MNEKVKGALKDIEIFFKQCEIENKYDKQLTNHFLNCKIIIETALTQNEVNEIAFRIIKIKEIDISLLLHCKDAEEYNYRLEKVALYPFATSQIIRTISQVEFEIVKEAVKKYGQ